jgi:hypothetical protein
MRTLSRLVAGSVRTTAAVSGVCATHTTGYKHRQTVKLLPQPQVDFALGLRITNWAPVRPSL